MKSLLVAVLLLSALSSRALAQLGTATISGTIRDSSGAVVAGAEVTATSTATGFRRGTVSNDVGEFSLPGLTPGQFDLAVRFQGFKQFSNRDLTLQVDQNAHFDITLEVGQSTEIVEVQSQAPLVESQTSSLGAVVDTQKILALPLNGRNFVELALLVPGANTGAPGAGTGGGFSVSGLRSEQNAFQIDGTSNSDAFENNISFRPSIDALQEFKIQTNNYSAEFGKGAGAQVNVITKSGTRQLHGTLFYFNRDDVFQARRFFDTNRVSFPCDKNDPNVTTRAACAPPFNQNQFGFTLGGPWHLFPKLAGNATRSSSPITRVSVRFAARPGCMKCRLPRNATETFHRTFCLRRRGRMPSAVPCSAAKSSTRSLRGR